MVTVMPLVLIYLHGSHTLYGMFVSPYICPQSGIDDHGHGD